MPDAALNPLFRRQDVEAVASRLSDAGAALLHTREFQAACEGLQRKRMTGEANTREKVIEPILYDVLGFDRGENDAEHAVNHAGAGGDSGAVEYFFRIGGNDLPIEAKAWGKSLDKKDSSGRSPARQGWDYAGLSNCRWFIVTSGSEWRLYKTQLRGSESPLSACERYYLKDLIEERKQLLRFYATFRREAFKPDREGICPVDELRKRSEQWQESISEAIYDKLVESRLLLFRAIQSQLPDRPQAQINEAVVKLLFRIMFIRFAEDTPLLPNEFLAREVIQRFEQDRKWGRDATLYGYVQQYFAWLDGRSENQFNIYPYDGALFDPDPVLDDPQLRIDDRLFQGILVKLSREAMGRPIDYSQINPRILGNVYERFLGYVIEIKERRLDPQVGRDTRRKEGTFYTPQSVTKFLVEHAVDEALAREPGRKPWDLACLDPACGSGHFLVEFVNYAAARCEELDDRRSYQQWKRHLTQHGAFGVDKDPTAVMLTKLSLWINSAMKDEPFVTIDSHVKCGNSLVCGTPPGFRLADYEKKAYPEKFRELKRLRKGLAELESRAASDGSLFTAGEALDLHRQIRGALSRIEEAKEPIRREFTRLLRERCAGLEGAAPFHWEVEFAEVFEEQGGFDLIVGNPPWGADLADIRGYLDGGAFDLARGQYDSYELFIELARRLLRKGGSFGFIVPDSITLPEHEPLRRMLLEGTTLTRLVRAGEGLFPSVFRAAFFVCFANQAPPPEQRTRVATLRKDDRRLFDEDTLLQRSKTIAEVVQKNGHDVSQTRFRANPRYEIDILATGLDAPVVARIDERGLDWASLTEKGRGVEIGKSGEVLQCPYCYKWDNVPRKVRGAWRPKICRHCGREFAFDKAANHEVIIAEKPRGKHWRPIISGEVVNRYWLGGIEYIDTTKDGINYKAAEFYEGKRLLVRQTGVGIYATIDESRKLTNQSVFTWKLRKDLQAGTRYRLEYILGVVNSRTMLYRYYMKSGDTEWRSFPRWTQELVQELPIRAIDFSQRRERQLHDEIAERVAAVLASGKPPSTHDDYQIEISVMQLYGITRAMCRRIFDVLHQVQRLRVIREMSIAEPDMLLDALPADNPEGRSG
ncbi:MAG: TaqI-like C-terminal specificity domain-containing protein [Thermoguttaceae bacterium]|jgi:ribosomal protein L37AE/L43A